MATTGTICQLLHTLHVGGAEVLAARLARQLSSQYRFLFACLDELGTLGQQLRDEGFPVFVLDRQPGVDWRCPVRLAKLLRRERVDVVQAHQYTPFFYAMTARLLYRRPPLLFTEHGRHFPDYPRRKRMVVNRLLLERRDRVVAVGQAVQRAVADNEGIPIERVSVIHNGIDLMPYRNGLPDRSAVRRELGLRDEDFLLVHVARLDYLKDHPTAVRALEQLVRRRPDAHLLLVGEGPERGRIKKEIQERRLEANAHMLGQRSDVARLLRAADLFLLTSISEGIPLTVIEAMAAGLPVVGTRVGGMTEVVEEGLTGLLAPSGDFEALADCIFRLSGDPELRRQMGQRARERANAMFSERQMHAGYCRLYEEMLSLPCSGDEAAAPTVGT